MGRWSRNRARVGLTVLFAALILLVVLGFRFRGHRILAGDRPFPEIPDRPSVQGILKISGYGETGSGIAPTRHLTPFVNGPDYSGMEDNDLRGFLDGTFRYGWNQPTQVHVRIGRRDSSPRYGEYELFRVLHRWDSIRLPPGSKVLRASLTLAVEEAPDETLRIVLYPVNKDYDPGQGGALRDNVSPPVPGEVWWNDVGYREQPWGLPGCGFASENHPDADTPAMPLAEALLEPGGERIDFSSSRLADYVTQQVRAERPLLFLLKLADYLEDTPGTIVTIYSGNHGDSRSVGRRPQLTIEWVSENERIAQHTPIFLENGRTLAMPQIDLDRCNQVALSLAAAPGSGIATLELRGGKGEAASPWQRAAGVIDEDWDWIEARVTAAVDPVVLGSDFTAEMIDTWVLTAPPEDQRVPWAFRSPSGRAEEILADYLGENRWTVSFVPNEIGPWTYSWSQNFTDTLYQSEIGHFDVLPGNLANVRAQLESLAAELRRAGVEKESAEIVPFMSRFSRLERSLMAHQTPESFRSRESEELRALLREVRGLLGGPVPDSIPMLPNKPPKWQTD